MKFKHLFLLFLLLSILLNVGYFLLLGPDSFVTINDNLDSEFSYLELLKNAGHLLTFWANPMIDGVMAGIPRAAFRSPLNVTVWLYAVLPPFWMYVLNKLLVHLIGFGGMYLLLQQQVIKQHRYAALTSAFIFSLISYYHIQYGISIAGQPLLLWAFLSILRREQRYYHWMVVALFPFYSFMVVTLPFFLPFLAVLGIWHYYQHKQLNTGYWLSLLLYIGISTFVEFPLLYSTVFDPQFVSHREVWNPFKLIGYPSLAGNLKRIMLDALVTPYHAGSMLTLPIMVALLAAVIVKQRITLLQVVLVASINGIVVWASMNDWLVLALMDKYKIIKMFNIDRFNFLLPMLWLLLLATTLAALNLQRPEKRSFALVMSVMVILCISAFDPELKNNTKLLLGLNINEPTYRQFYAPELFAQIKNTIGLQPQNYRVVTLGASPNIALFNGLQTLDSYQNNYPLAYKNEFRKIIAGELAKDVVLRNYFDFWGSRSYVFSAELGKDQFHNKYSPAVVKNLSTNTAQIKAMGADYMIAAVPVANATTLHLKLVKTFTSPDAFWKFYLYQLR